MFIAKQKLTVSLGMLAYLWAITCGDLFHDHHHGPAAHQQSHCQSAAGTFADRSHSHAGHRHCHKHVHVCDHHVHEHGHRHAEQAPATPPDHEHSDDHDHDCSICRFHAQQPLICQVVVLEICVGVAAQIQVDLVPQLDIPFICKQRSRAPPVV